MTHYPKHSQTFLIDEVVAVGSEDLTVVPIALNEPSPGDIDTEIEQRESARTLYLKAVPPIRVLRTLLSTVRRNPTGVIGVFVRALRAAGADARDALWSAFYFVEAVLAWDHCERNGCRHLHAQFGTAPASVAMLAADIGNRVAGGERPVTWSYSVHGYTEFTQEDAFDIVRKTRSAAFVVGVSDYTRSQLMRLSSPEEWVKLHRVHVGIDLDHFAYCPRADVHTPPTVLSVGRLSPEKGQLSLLEAVGCLKSRGVAVRAKVIGDGPSSSQLREHARALGIEDRVEFTGALPAAAVAAELADADVFCLASFAEGIPVSVMEALACGVPVVATLVGGVPELVECGTSGLTVPAGRPDLVADAIETLVGDPELRARVQREGRRRVETGHDIRRTSAQMRELLLAHA
jgi:glycosyltransferase involved in cell wall biosynthesis